MMKRLFVFILLSIPLLLFFVACIDNTKEDTLFLYDTIVNIKINGENEDLKEVEKILELYDKLSDNYKEHKDVNNIYSINKKRSLECSYELIELLNYSLEMKEKTQGYFNPLIGKVAFLYKELINEERTYNQEFIDEVNSELDKMNNSSITIEDNLVTINGEADIDLGAIAKGFALKKVKEYLDNKGIKNYLINAGSSSIIMGEKSNNEYYKVGLKNYTDRVFLMKNKSLGTSSIFEQSITIDGKLFSHIINPFTGLPSNLYDTIYLIGDDPALIDAFTTALFSLELDDIKTITSKYNLDYVIYKDNQKVASSSEGDTYD